VRAEVYDNTLEELASENYLEFFFISGAKNLPISLQLKFPGLLVPNTETEIRKFSSLFFTSFPCTIPSSRDIFCRLFIDDFP
jgi:hypothetical protein